LRSGTPFFACSLRALSATLSHQHPPARLGDPHAGDFNGATADNHAFGLRPQAAAGWRDIPVIVITSLDPDAKDRARLNSGMQSVLVKERFRPADLVERIRRLVHKKPEVISGMEAAS